MYIPKRPVHSCLLAPNLSSSKASCVILWTQQLSALLSREKIDEGMRTYHYTETCRERGDSTNIVYEELLFLAAETLREAWVTDVLVLEQQNSLRPHVPVELAYCTRCLTDVAK
jgi:hypothetical protein